MDRSSSASMDSEDMFNFVSIRTLKPVSIPLSEIGYGSCRSVNEFEKVRRLGEGTYGVVFEGRDKKSGETVALKQVRMNLEKEGLSISAIREIQSLQRVEHENVVRLHEVVVGKRVDKVFLVMEFCNQDLASLLDAMQSPFTESQVKCLLLQLFSGLEYLHSLYMVHRDIKASNLLLNDKGVLKIADFGLARLYGDPPSEMTPRVVTLWYRSPELLFGSKHQSTAIDMWSCGCIAGELLLHKPLLPGKDEIDQIRLIIYLLGTPTEDIWPGFSELPMTSKVHLFQQPYDNIKTNFPDLSPEGTDLLHSLFVYDPQRRATAAQCLQSPYFTISPLPCDPTMMPSLRSLTKKRRTSSSATEK